MNRSAEDIPREAAEAEPAREPQATPNAAPEEGGEAEVDVEDGES